MVRRGRRIFNHEIREIREKKTMKYIFLVQALIVAFAFGAWFGNRPATQSTNAILHAGYGACGRCNRTWDVVTGHDTPYEWSKPGKLHDLITGNDVPATNIFRGDIPKELAEYLSTPQPTRGCFPLCKQCWQELKTPEARLPYYRKLVDDWKRDIADAEKDWEPIKASVLAGN